MAKDLPDILPVPEETQGSKMGRPGVDDVTNPIIGAWWTSQTISGVPENVMGWLVAQGWQITAMSADNTTNPPTYTYALKKLELDNGMALIQMCNSYTKAANDAKHANETRYNDVVREWKEMNASSQEQFDAQIEHQNVNLGVYINDLDTHMTDIDNLSKANIDELKLDYNSHRVETRSLLYGLGAAEEARINEHFAATLATQLQGLTDRGLYSSAVAADITARNQRDLDEELQKHYTALAREKVVNEHTIYGQRSQLSDHTHKAIVEQMNTSAARLDGWKSVSEDNQKLMAYQLDVRNQLLVGLFSFIERRDDIAPQWKDMSQMIAGLADQAGGWITP